jgi:hypothetical protein
MPDDSLTGEWPGISCDREPALTRGPLSGSVQRPNEYRILQAAYALFAALPDVATDEIAGYGRGVIELAAAMLYPDVHPTLANYRFAVQLSRYEPNATG